MEVLPPCSERGTYNGADSLRKKNCDECHILVNGKKTGSVAVLN